MKKGMLIINFVVIAAVIGLYVLFFLGNKKTVKHKKSSDVVLTGDYSKSIYYINFDTVMANYKMYLDIQQQLEQDLNSSEAQLKSQESQFQKEVNDYQSQMQKGLLLRSEAQQREQELAGKQQMLMNMQENLRAQLAEKQVVFNRKMLDEIMKYLEEIQSEYNYHFVLGTQFGGGVLYANKELDITWEVIEGLNEKYDKEKGKED